jgi:uncharacterized protein
MPATTPRETVERLVRAATSADPGDMADCYATEVVIEMPFATPALYPARIETTREQLRARFRAGTALRRYTGLDRLVIHETTDPEVVIAEYALRGERAATGEPFTLPFLMVVTVRDGRIVHSRDYTYQVAGARVLGRIPELVAALTTG